MTFVVAGKRVEVATVSNQSTGFCPQPQSWNAVARALDGAGLPRPDDFTTSFEFRRCDRCGAVNLVKDD